MLPRTRRSQRGFTLAEVMMATALIGVLVYATVTITSTGLQLTKGNMDKQFATQKAISMLEELKALVQVNQGAAITVLDAFDDGTAYRARLTTVGVVQTDPPSDPVSGNTNLGPTYSLQTFGIPLPNGPCCWMYSRQISVRPLTDPNNPLQIIGSTDVRLVRVRVYKNDVAGPRLLAEVASVIRTLAVSFPPTQVYDVYCVAIENVPGWWVNMSALVPFVQAAINDLQDRHPGLEFRQHWITHLSFGRDTQYKPYINQTIAAATPANTPTAIPFAYFYPGRFPDNYTPEAGGAAVASPAQFYYPPSNFDATLLDDSAVPTGLMNPQDPSLNPIPYALADMYNHAMRYYQELDLWNQRSTVLAPAVAPAVVGNLAYPIESGTPTLRLLIDDMYMNPNKYTNALVINLHGELLPFPPTRNYSDAAKKPDQYPNNGVRVVTHPEQLTFGNNDSVALRVYSYVMHPDAIDGSLANEITYTGPAFPGSSASLSRGLANVNKEYLREPITVVLRGINWDPGAVTNCILPGNPRIPGTNYNCVAAITGGVDLDTAVQSGIVGNFSPRDPYTTVAPAATTNFPTAPLTNRMYYVRSYIAPVAPAIVGDTVIKLYNSPLVSPCVPFPSDCSFDQTAGVGGSGGIEHVAAGNWTKRLYGLEYIPSPMENFAQIPQVTAFGRDLDLLGAQTKNTARWVLTIPINAFTNNRALQVETYLGDFTPNSTTLTMGRQISGTFAPAYAEPTNLSMTFLWRGDNNYLYGNPAAAPPVPPALPLTERFQMLGDPRHCPYADLKKPHADNGGTWDPRNVDTNIGMGYNRFFDDFEDAFGNETMAWEVNSKNLATYAVAAGNNLFAVKINGTSRNVTLTNGAARTPAQIVADLNGNAGFSANAFADVFNGRIRVRSKSGAAGSSVQFDVNFNATATACATNLGYTNTVINASWNGWNYTIGGVDFGVKNSGVYNPSAAQQADDEWATTNGDFEIDVPRMFQCFRSALMRTNSVYTTMTGWPYYYLGIGNEIGYDGANGWPDNVPVSRRPFQGTDAAQYFEQTITPGKNWGDADTDRCGVKYIQEASATPNNTGWWGMNWIGELYPDNQYDIPLSTNDWKIRGNLPVPTPPVDNPNTAARYLRIRRDPNPLGGAPAAPAATPHLVANDPNNYSHTPGTTFQPGARRTHEQGTGTFFWSGSASTVQVPANSSQGTLAAGGNEINTNYNFPLDSPIPANRGFIINGAAPANDSLSTLQPMYGPQNNLSQQWDTLGLFYDAADGNTPPNLMPPQIASELLAMRAPGAAPASNNIAYIVENGLSPSGVAGTDFIARWSFLSLVQSYFDAGRFPGTAGNPGAAPAVNQVPRVNITNPNANTNTSNPSTLNITWNLNWQRWDGLGYTTAYPSPYTPAVAPTLSYFLTYSADNGKTWVYLQNPARTATPGVRLQPGDPDYVGCRLTAQTYTWNGVASLPEGAYIIRVEAYRDQFPLHYATHQYQIFINR
jgi:prepilin-type N-terminal cleavage/methylation domain-containing protein